ncbi:hypothetical protein TNIN_480861 [Trichonephila inaurata madagascariensis]|uniref:Uncharacterized protein n=1 Tax=Trichonephila inaurata madagascariensis TaxID=2747483 RepID=A0A8X7CD43_9ARAC|nr:hypothetical protein TNIN_480861 [Trichonephila inaurata madagascariensis]
MRLRATRNILYQLLSNANVNTDIYFMEKSVKLEIDTVGSFFVEMFTISRVIGIQQECYFFPFGCRLSTLPIGSSLELMFQTFLHHGDSKSLLEFCYPIPKKDTERGINSRFSAVSAILTRR